MMRVHNGSAMALAMGDAFELINWLNGDSTEECLMDLQNNTLGAHIADMIDRDGSDEQIYSDCESLCQAAGSAGILKHLTETDL
ncbi:hypothetical protein HKB23_18120 [Vibrio parahaemolyticus]|nr:hypothetical protein [Vibrio parahaemolyticus]